MPSPSPNIRVLIADDHSIWRAGMRSDLGPGFDVVGEAASADEAITQARALRPDVVVSDLRMPGGGLRVIEAIGSDVPVVLLTVSSDAEDLLDAVAAGAAGYLLKSSTTDELRAGLGRAARGEAVFSPSLAALVLGADRRGVQTPDGKTVRPLSQREREVLGLVAQGLSYREVGEDLYISERTVERHVANILAKLHLSRRSELVSWAVRRGLVE